MNPVGMLRYRDQRGLTQGVEASTITRIEGLSPQEQGCISKIHFKAESPVLSLDGAADLMDEYDEIVDDARFTILLREDPTDMIRKLTEEIIR